MTNENKNLFAFKYWYKPMLLGTTEYVIIFAHTIDEANKIFRGSWLHNCRDYGFDTWYHHNSFTKPHKCGEMFFGHTGL